MFTPGPVTMSAARAEGDHGPFTALQAAIAQITGARGRQGSAPRQLAFLVWALSHGIATLWAAGFPPADAGVMPRDLLRVGVAALIKGMEIDQPAPGHGQAAGAAPGRSPAKTKRVARP
jgi:hypothetical protein